MEDFTPEIENMLEEKLGLYQKLNILLKEEREFIVNIDVESLWKTSEIKKKRVQKIEALKEKILFYFEAKFNLNGMDIKSFSISHLIRTFPFHKEIKAKLRRLKLAIENEKNELGQVASENKKFVQEYLGIIDDIMSVAVDNSKQAQYDFSGTMPETKNSNCLIHAQV